jgi:hypothetical protein
MRVLRARAVVLDRTLQETKCLPLRPRTTCLSPALSLWHSLRTLETRWSGEHRPVLRSSLDVFAGVILGMPVSDRATLRGRLTQFETRDLSRCCKLLSLKGEMSEWLKEHAWKACVGETLPWVRIPLSPPAFVAYGDFGWVALRATCQQVCDVRSLSDEVAPIARTCSARRSGGRFR